MEPTPSVALYDVIMRRRDVRGEFTGEPVDPVTLRRVLEAAHAAPSVGLTQPWDFVVVTDPDLRRSFHKHVESERSEFAATLEGERAETFAGIKIDGVLEASLSVVVTYDTAQGLAERPRPACDCGRRPLFGVPRHRESVARLYCRRMGHRVGLFLRGEVPEPASRYSRAGATGRVAVHGTCLAPRRRPGLGAPRLA